MKIVKWLLIVVATLLVLVVAAAITVPILYKDQLLNVIQKQANEELKGELAFEDVGISLFKQFPKLTLSLEKFSIVGAQPFEGDTLVSISSMDVAIDLLSTISALKNNEALAIRSISLIEPHVYIRVLEDGTASWDIVPESGEEEKPEKDDGENNFNLRLNSFKIKNGIIEYDDATLGMRILAKGYDQNLKGDFTADVFDLVINSSIEELSVSYGGIPYLNKVKTKIKVGMEIDNKKLKYTFKDNEIVLNHLPLLFSGFISMPETGGVKMDVKFEARETSFKHILSLVPAVYASDFKGLKSSGQMAFSGFVKGLYIDNTMPAFKLNLSIKDGQFKYPSLPDEVRNVQMELLINNPDGVPDHTSINLKKFHAELGKEKVDATLKMKTPISDPEIDAAIKGRIDLANISNFIELEDVSQLKGNVIVDLILKGKMSSIERKQYDKFNATGKLDITQMKYVSSDWPDGIRINKLLMLFSPKAVNLKTFNAKIGSSDIRAQGSLNNFIAYILKGDMLKGNLTIDSKLLDLNEMMGSTNASGGGGQPGSGGGSESIELSVFELPGNIHFKMIADIENLIYDNMVLKNVMGTMELKDRVLTLNKLRMNTLGGMIIMSGSYATLNRHRPKINMDLNLKNLDIQRSFETFVTIQKFAPVAQYTKGKFSSNLSISGFLQDDMMPELATLSGKGKLTILNAVIKNFKPLVAVANAIKIDKYKELKIGKINPSFKILDGRIYVDPFDILLGKTNLKVSGSNGLDETLDYLLNFQIPKSELGSKYNSVSRNLIGLAKEKGIDLPQSDVLKFAVLLGGTMLVPKVATQFLGGDGNTKEEIKEVIKEKVEEEIKEIVEEKKEEIKEDVKKQAREQAAKILKEAEAQAKRIRDAAKQSADKVKKEGYAQADQIEKNAKNPVAKIAAKEAAKKLRQETDKKAKRIIDEANVQADKILKAARKKADALLK